MHKILQRQELEYQIFVINQVGNDPFNRAKLLNVGFIEALKLYDWDCFVFHDVDLGKIDFKARVLDFKDLRILKIRIKSNIRV